MEMHGDVLADSSHARIEMQWKCTPGGTIASSTGEALPVHFSPGTYFTRGTKQEEQMGNKFTEHELD